MNQQKPTQWPEASGVFNAPRTLVMTTALDSERRSADTVLVATPLDLIRHLEDPTNGLVTVILTDRFASDSDLIAFLREYRVQVVVEHPVAARFDTSESLVA